MKAFLKKYLPSPIKKIILYVKSRSIDKIDKIYKIYLVKKMSQRHIKFISNLKDKTRVKVVFFVLHESTWKVDSVFQNMLQDEFFEPIILVCPYVVYGEERMFSDMHKTYKYFIDKSYPVISSYDEKSKHWLDLKEISPDIVFFTNPHNLTRREYYEDAYLNYLSCYVPYHHEVGSYGGDIAQYGGEFQAALWLFFSSHNDSRKQFLNHFPQKKENNYVVGYPAMQELLEKLKTKPNDPWVSNDTRVRIIWAPHHSIDMDRVLPYSSFLIYAQYMLYLVEKYNEQVIWSFKPHPILKSKLYIHPDWGKEKTDQYFSFWENGNNTQLDLSEYFDLFACSDAMIHDCGSFLAEYLYTQKPVLYLLNKGNDGGFYNDFGKKALQQCSHGRSESDIENFIKELIHSNSTNVISSAFYEDHLASFFLENTPSGRIIQCIKDKIHE